MAPGTGRHGDSDSEFRLGEASWKALLAAANLVVDELRDDVDELIRGRSISDSNLVELMPRRFLPRYDLAFAQHLTERVSDLLLRLERGCQEGWAYPHETFLKSVVEEMLMAQIIRYAIDDAASDESREELQALEDLSFEDRDFEWLYDLSHDGITDDPEVARTFGFANLRFEDWFKPFR